ncbi:hypothetical protein OXX80_010719 [Metschnikowia pulcherrima]
MSKSLRDVIGSFKYDQDEVAKPKSVSAAKIVKTSPKKRKPASPTKHAKSHENLRDLPPSIRPGLTIVFVGFNPGVESSRQQHHYAHPTNLFWKLFNQSDLLSAVLDFRNTDVACHRALLDEVYTNGNLQARPEHDFALIELGVGFTDLVLRCTKQASELSSLEKAQNIPRLLGEFNASNAPFVVFVGKGIWEVVCKYLVPGHKLTAASFMWGLQSDPVVMSRFYSFCEYRPRVYVFPNTSGLVASMKYPEKLGLWDQFVKDMQHPHQESTSQI